MLARILALFRRRPVEAPQAPAHDRPGAIPAIAKREAPATASLPAAAVDMVARILALFQRRPVEAPQAPAHDRPGAIPAIAKGEAPATAPLPAAAVDMVAAFEGFRAEAYLCPAKVYTIGHGTTRWGNRQPVAKGDGPITKEAARRLLENDLADAAKAVDDLVTVPLADHQRAALTSFVHNVGRGAFARSTLLMHLNAGRLESAAGEFTRWTKAAGVVLPGLVKRRAAEARLFRGGGEPSSKA